MAKMSTANFAPNQKTWTAALSDNSTGTELLVTAGPEGAIVTSVTAMPRETVTASSLLLFLSRYGGTTQRLIASELLPAHTMDATAATPITAFEGISETSPIRLEAGDQLFIGTGAAGNIVAFAQSIDYQSRAPEPKNVEPPAIERPAVEGNVATVDVGLWSGYPTPEITVQWLRDGVPIAGATALEYVPTTDDTFLPLSVAVTAANSSGSETVVTQALMVQPDAAVSWLYSDMAETIFVDVDGNTPATWGDPVGLIKDSSGNGNDFTQPTVTARPILGRVPRGGRRNLLEWTEELNRNPWSTLRATVEMASGIEHPDGLDVWVITENPDATTHGALTFPPNTPEGVRVGSLDVFPLETPYLGLRLYSGMAADFVFGVDLSTMTVNLPNLGSPAGWVDDIGGGWYRVFFRQGITGNARFYVYTSVSGEAGDSSAGGLPVYIARPMLNMGDAPLPYQRVTNGYDITESGVPEVHYLYFDGTDDLISTELPAIENGTLVIAGTGGIWIDDDYSFDGGTFSIGTTSYTNGPEGILTAIGEPIVGGSLVINRQLSQRERDLVIQEMKERGAPGVFELGPEYANTEQSYDKTTDDNLLIPMVGTIVPQTVYFVDLQIENKNAGTFPSVWLRTTLGTPHTLPTQSGNFHWSAFITAANGGSNILGVSGPSARLTVARVSVRKLELIP